MRKSVGLKAAVLSGSACLVMSALSAQAQLVNPTWESPNDGASGTDTVATGWTMSPAANPDFGYTNPGNRDTFYNSTPGGAWSFWLQTFTQSGNATQTVAATDGGVTIASLAGTSTPLTFSSLMAFQDGSGPGQGYNAVTLANQTETIPAGASPNTGDLYSYLGLVFLNGRGSPIGTLDADGVNIETTIPAGSVTAYNSGNGASAFAPYSVTGTVPAGAASVEVVIGWQNGGNDGNTGGQSAFADDQTLNVPEPATLGLLSVGGMALLARRRRTA